MKAIYLEPDEEITSIIDRLSKINESEIAVVVPKNSTMFQSLVNLKLLARQAQKLGKTVAIISSNKIGSRLAKQVGLETYANLGIVAGTSLSTVGPTPAILPAGPDTLPDGTPIHRYSPDATVQLGETIDSAGAAVNQSDPIEPSPSIEPDQPSPQGAISQNDESVADNEEITDQSAPSPKVPARPDALPPIVTNGLRTDSEFIFPWKSALVALAMVLVASIFTFLFLPKATVTLTFPAKLLSETFVLSAKTGASAGDGVIGGNLLTVEKTATKEITASGKKDIGTKASGSISIKNCEDTNNHALAAGSKATASGKVFITSSTVTVPAGQFASGGTVCNSTSVAVNVSASEVGDGYNLTNVVFSLAGLPSRISGSGSTTGGITKQITVLAQDDVTLAYGEIKTQLIEDGTNELKGKAGHQTIINEAIQAVIIEQKVDKEVGSQTDKATVSMTVDVLTIAFDQTAIELAAKDKLTTKIGEG